MEKRIKKVYISYKHDENYNGAMEAIKRGLDISLLEAIIKKLANQEPLPPENRDHQLYLLPIARWGVFLYLTTLKTYTTIK